ncbi:MAG: membrane protein insertion efficiency factor YidD [Candidatus Omnitrophota bacterium]
MAGKALIFLLNVYQKYLRAVLPISCRFSPSCSEYTKQAVNKYGFIQGLYKGLKRILRCHPFNKCCGYDPLR